MDMVKFLTSTTATFTDLLPKYDELPDKAKVRIQEFSLVWQLFENTLFECHATKEKIEKVNIWLKCDADDFAELVESELKYFKDRYADAEDASEKLYALVNGHEDVQTTIELGLSNAAPPVGKVRGLAFVCQRLRNNLFHGTKAGYGFENQIDNFYHAINFMNKTLGYRPDV